MTSTNRIQRIALCLIIIFTVSAIAFANATTENNYNNDTNLLPNIFESTHTENGYKANIIINPDVTGIYAQENGYKLDLAINPTGIGGSLNENNYKLDLIPEKTFVDSSDVAVTEILCSKTIIGQGYSIPINITLANQALNYETLYVTISANTTTLKTQTVTLVGSTFKTLTLTLNTSSLTKGNYTISAIAEPVPGETDTSANTFTYGVVKVTIPGDVDGNFKINMGDISALCDGFGATIGPDGNYRHHPPGILDPFSPNLDIDGNGRIDMGDITTAVDNFGHHYP